MNWEWRDGKTLRYLYLPEWEQRGVQVAFTTRDGGASQGPFSSLNMALHVGDDPLAVMANRRRCLKAWDCPEGACVIGEQVHGVNTAWVTQADAGRGYERLETAVPGVDALITADTGLGLMAFFADCIPIWFYQPDIGAVAIAHAGWKGTVGKIAERVLRALCLAGGAVENCFAAIGPGIGACCYEVDEVVAAKFREAGLPYLKPGRPGHYFLDLAEINYLILRQAGVPAGNIARAEMCTACHQEFFSYRRDGKVTGRMAGWIRIMDKVD